MVVFGLCFQVEQFSTFVSSMDHFDSSFRHRTLAALQGLPCTIQLAVSGDQRFRIGSSRSSREKQSACS